uniref:Uncharacterized protein n=1 Tax=Picea sitchensis TaxID=3332 RepID=A9NW75_PICSI|nr:unknown [Picea sitchensis]
MDPAPTTANLTSSLKILLCGGQGKLLLSIQAWNTELDWSRLSSLRHLIEMILVVHYMVAERLSAALQTLPRWKGANKVKSSGANLQEIPNGLMY